MHPGRYLFLVFLLFVQAPLVFAESDIPGWGKVKWGMTYAEVNKIYELNQWEPGKIPTSKMKKKVKIMGHDFAVAFYFDERSNNGILYKVVLVHFNTDKTDASWLNSIKEILVEKYGNPISFEIKDNMKISRWRKSEGRLKLTTLTDKTVMCAVEYDAVQTEGRKL
jgi:hypothetical protein